MMTKTRATPVAAALLGFALWAGPVLAQQVPPSDAVKLALAAVPGAEPLGVKLKGDHYVVRLKLDGSVVQVLVDAATGQVSQ